MRVLSLSLLIVIVATTLCNFNVESLKKNKGVCLKHLSILQTASAEECETMDGCWSRTRIEDSCTCDTMDEDTWPY